MFNYWKLPALLASVALGGCALPGYDSGSFNAEHWYNFGGNRNGATYDDALSKETRIDYDPSVINITPGLIAHLHQQNSNQKLPPRVAALTGEPKNMNYVIGDGDVLQIIVFGHPELTNPGQSGSGGGDDTTRGQLVNADGDIFYPYVGRVKAAGKTPEQLREDITQRLSNYIRQPQVDIRVREYRSQKVYISGDIDKPCTVPITDIALTVIEALDECDSLASKEGGGTGVQNIRLIRGGKSTLINLSRVYASGADIPLQPGDKLLVDDTANRVFILGEFDKQLALPYSTGGMSLSDAMADAGGVSLDTANTSGIYVIRGFVDGRDFKNGGVKVVKHPIIYKLDASNPGGLLLANQFELQPRDIVFAAPASLVNFNRALSLILPSVSALTQGFYLYDRIGRE